MSWMNINNANIYYEVHGQGQPLVLIAGFGCDHSFWMPLIDGLSSQFKILILDNRGSGQTQDDNKGFTIEVLADDVMGLVNALAWKKPHVIGHSMGGTIAQTLAVKYSNELGKIMLCNAAAKFNGLSSIVLHNVLALQKAKLSIELLTATFMPWVFSESFLVNPSKVAFYLKAVKEYPFPSTLEGNARQVKALDAFDLKKSFGKIQAETLILGADRDLLASAIELQFLKDHINNATLRILPGAHVMIMEQPQETIKIIKEFLGQ
jgi:3-oxoadipate enol-lactonase